MAQQNYSDMLRRIKELSTQSDTPDPDLAPVQSIDEETLAKQEADREADREAADALTEVNSVYNESNKQPEVLPEEPPIEQNVTSNEALYDMAKLGANKDELHDTEFEKSLEKQITPESQDRFNFPGTLSGVLNRFHGDSTPISKMESKEDKTISPEMEAELNKPTTEEKPKPSVAPVGEYSSLLERLNQAQSRRGGYDQAALLAAAGQQMMSGGVQIGGGKYAPDYKMSDLFAKMGEGQAKDISEERKLAETQSLIGKRSVETSHKQALDDPNSSESKGRQKLLEFLDKETFDKYGPEEVAKMSANQLDSVSKKLTAYRGQDIKASEGAKGRDAAMDRAELFAQGREKTIGLSKERFELEKQRQTEAEAKNKLQAQKTYADYIQKVKGTEVFKDLEKQKASFGKINSLVDAATKGSETALNSLGTVLARAEGQVGVLTDKDVQMYLPNASLAMQVSNWIHKKGVGKLPQMAAEDIKGFTKLMRDIADRDLKAKYREYAYDFAKTYPSAAPTELDRQNLFMEMSSGSQLENPEGKQKQTLTDKDKQAIMWAKDPNSKGWTKDKADKILKLHPGV